MGDAISGGRTSELERKYMHVVQLIFINTHIYGGTVSFLSPFLILYSALEEAIARSDRFYERKTAHNSAFVPVLSNS